MEEKRPMLPYGSAQGPRPQTAGWVLLAVMCVVLFLVMLAVNYFGVKLDLDRGIMP